MSSLYYPPSANNTVTLSSPGSGYTIGVAGSSSIYTSPMYNGSSWNIAAGTTTASTVGQAGTLTLNGANADILINGVSLKDAITRIEERLNILTVNTGLEKEWAELKEIGDRYRELEKEIKDKMKTWDILKKDDI